MSGELQNETILETIERRLIPDEQAKKARGEVFTPLKLVRELLYGLRKADLEAGNQVIWGINEDGECIDDDPENRVGGIPLNFWRDRKTKWLDPANGIGNFPFVAFHMLDFQLKHHGSKRAKAMSDEARRRHIVDRMLFMIEIDKGNVNTSYKVMDYLAPGSKPHICCADTLKVSDDDLMRHFEVNRFDVVMGNPPFNMRRDVKGQTGTLWDKFIVYGMNCLKESGYLAFITPANWRRPESKLYSEMTLRNQLEFVHILGERETRETFGAGARVDVYTIQKAPYHATTHVIDELSKYHVLDLKDFPFLPNYAYDAIRSILVPEASGIDIIFSSSIYEHRKKHVKKEKSAEFKYPIVHSMTQAGLGFLYTNDNTKAHFGQPKVLLNVGRHQYPYNDYAGQYGMSQIVFGLPIASQKEGDAIVEAINTDQFKEIIRATKWGAFQTDHRMFKYFRPDFYKQFLKKPEVAKRKTIKITVSDASRKTRPGGQRSADDDDEIA